MSSAYRYPFPTSGDLKVDEAVSAVFLGFHELLSGATLSYERLDELSRKTSIAKQEIRKTFGERKYSSHPVARLLDHALQDVHEFTTAGENVIARIEDAMTEAA